MVTNVIASSLSWLEGFIGNYAFPIVCCVAMGYYIYKTNENYRSDLDTVSQRHKEEMASVINAINNNTLIMQKLCDKLGEEVNLNDV